MSPSPPNCPRGRAEAAEFAPPERLLLLQLAHQAVWSALEQHELRLVAPFPAAEQRRAAFTTLYLQGSLRGCVGYVVPVKPLYEVVAETARAACFEDVRFPPVTVEEARELQISLSVLSSLRRVDPQRVAEEIELGRDGLLLTQHGLRGLLLPRVPVDQGWDLDRFLEQACRKAGLSEDAWRNGAIIEAFTTEEFGDRDQNRGEPGEAPGGLES